MQWLKRRIFNGKKHEVTVLVRGDGCYVTDAGAAAAQRVGELILRT